MIRKKIKGIWKGNWRGRMQMKEQDHCHTLLCSGNCWCALEIHGLWWTILLWEVNSLHKNVWKKSSKSYFAKSYVMCLNGFRSLWNAKIFSNFCLTSKRIHNNFQRFLWTFIFCVSVGILQQYGLCLSMLVVTKWWLAGMLWPYLLFLLLKALIKQLWLIQRLNGFCSDDLTIKIWGTDSLHSESGDDFAPW